MHGILFTGSRLGLHPWCFRFVRDDRNVTWLIDIGDRGRFAEHVNDDRSVLDAIYTPGDLFTYRERMLARGPSGKQMQERRMMMRLLRVRRRIARASLRTLLLPAPTPLLLARPFGTHIPGRGIGLDHARGLGRALARVRGH
jgi:hypothetical protein